MFTGNNESIRKQEGNIVKDYFKENKIISLWKKGEKDDAIIYAIRDISLLIAYIVSYPIEKIGNITTSTLSKIDEIIISKLEEIWGFRKEELKKIFVILIK